MNTPFSVPRTLLELLSIQFKKSYFLRIKKFDNYYNIIYNNQRSLMCYLACLNVSCSCEERIGQMQPRGDHVQGSHSPLLKPLFIGEEIIIPHCSGKITIARSFYVFEKYIDELFDWIDKSEHETPPTPVRVSELKNTATIEQIFTSYGENLSQMAFTQHQIARFCATHLDRLRDCGHGTLFLIEHFGTFYVARVGLADIKGVFWIRFHDFSDDQPFAHDSFHRVVIPLLPLS